MAITCICMGGQDSWSPGWDSNLGYPAYEAGELTPHLWYSARLAACNDSDNMGFFLAVLVTCYRDFGNKTGGGFVWEQVFPSHQSAGFVSLLLTVVLVVLSSLPTLGLALLDDAAVRTPNYWEWNAMTAEQARPPTHSLGRLVQSSDEIYVGLVSGLVRFRTR